MKPGIMGRTQGERKETRPARNAMDMFKSKIGVI
jgi:hypothetical protein